MKETPVSVIMGGQAREIGYIKAWEDDPDTFDGWLSEAFSGPMDDLVANGTSERWARYRIVAGYMEALIKKINSTGGNIASGAPRLDAMQALEHLAPTAGQMERLLNAELWDREDD